MVISLVLIVVGFAGLIFGANWLVDGASGLAKKYNIPDLVRV
jgi:cation:H+ antiporter